MANPQLSVEINAKISAFTTGMANAANQVKAFGLTADSALLKTTQQAAALNKTNLSNFVSQIKNGQASLVKLDGSLVKIQPILSKLSVGSNQAAMALTNLGRVAQDAPFGFIGIQNNLNPLLESFQQLKIQAGSNAGALKLLASSLIGPAGLGLALSVVTSLFTAYTLWSQKAARADEEKKKATIDAKEALDDYVKSLDAKTRADVNGSISAQKEVLDLKLLYEASQNVLLPMNERIRAGKELKEQYPDAFKNFSAEQIALGKASKGYQQLATDIIALAKVEARKDIILDNEKEIAQLEQKAKKLKRQTELQEQINKQNKEDAKNTRITGGGLMGTSNATIDLTKAANLEVGLNKAKKEQAENQDLINKKVEENFSLLVDIKRVTETTKSITPIIGQADAEKIDKTAKNLKEIEKVVNTLAPSSNTGGIRLGGSNPEAQFQEPVIGNAMADAALKQYLKNVQEAYDATLKLDESLNNILNSGVTSGLSAAFATLGTSIADGGNVMNEVGKSLLSSLGGVMIQLGELAIATGVGIKAIQVALKSLNPAVAIAAGVSLIALGSFVKGKAASIGGGSDASSGRSASPIPRFATGVNNFSGGLAMVGERGPELVNLPTGSSVVANDRTNRILANGKGSDVVLNGNFEIGLESLFFALKKTEKRLIKQGGIS